MRRALALALVSVSLVGCSAGVEGTWVGNLDCDQVPFDVELTLEHDSKLVYVGAGTQDRAFKDLEGNETTVAIEFDATLELESKSGAQDLLTTLTCTSEETIRTLTGGADPEVVSEGCEPRRYDNYVVGWDGEDKLTLSGPDGCSGKLTRR